MLLCQAVSNLVKEGAQIDLYMFGRFASAEIVDKINWNVQIFIYWERFLILGYI